MKKIINKVFTVLGFVSLIFFISCSEDPTPSLYEIPSANLPTPVISSVSPSQQALAGVTPITINGANFLSNPEYNRVYFNGKPGKVLSAAPNRLVVIAPVVISDTVEIKISVVGSLAYSNSIKNYRLRPAVSELYPFDGSTKKQEFPYGICTDNLENVYFSFRETALAKGTKKIAPGATEYTDFAPDGPESFFKAITYASDNAVYAVRGGIRGVYRAVQGVAPVAFVSGAQGITDNVNDIEYDKKRDVLWGGGATGTLYRIRLDKNVKKFNISGVINALKVTSSYLFVVSRVNDAEEVIWRVPVVSADSVGTPEQYFNFTSSVSAAIRINDIELSADGDLYIGTNKIGDPLYVVHPNKTFEVVYPGLIEQGAYTMAWGTGTILYMSTITKDADGAEVNKSIFKIDLEKLRAN